MSNLTISDYDVQADIQALLEGMRTRHPMLLDGMNTHPMPTQHYANTEQHRTTQNSKHGRILASFTT